LLTNEWMLEIFVDTDTGAKGREDDSEPPPTEFNPADKSQTFLRLHAYICTADGSLGWFSEIWEELDWPEQDGEVTGENANVPIRIVRKSLALSELPDRGSVERAFAGFRELVAEKISELKLLPMPVQPLPPSSSRMHGERQRADRFSFQLSGMRHLH
jgi:hypothetical protein